jgi:hypothetical protein
MAIGHGDPSALAREPARWHARYHCPGRNDDDPVRAVDHGM